MSASLNDTPLEAADALPELLAGGGHSRATSSARSARPKQTAATCSRVLPSHSLATSNPRCSSPSRLAAGTRASSKFKMRLW